MENFNNSINSCVVHDHPQQRIVEEIDFFDVERMKKRFFVPTKSKREIVFTEILRCPVLNSLRKKRSNVDDDDDHMKKKKKRKFHVDHELSHHHHHHHHNHHHHNHNHNHNNPHLVRLFGVDIATSGINNHSPEKPMMLKRNYKPRNDFSTIHIQEPQNPNNITSFFSILRQIRVNGGSEPQLLFEKKLEKSDVNDCLGRLFVTKSEKLLEALTENERRIVLNEESKRGIRVYTLDAEGRVYELFFKRWPSLRMFVLNHDWRKLCNANRLQKGDVVQGRGYRLNSEFRLVLNFIRRYDRE